MFYCISVHKITERRNFKHKKVVSIFLMTFHNEAIQSIKHFLLNGIRRQMYPSFLHSTLSELIFSFYFMPFEEMLWIRTQQDSNYFHEWQQKIVFFFSSSFADMPVVTLKMGSSLNPDDIKEGADVYFECLIQSNPKPYKMSWYHNVSFSMSHCEDMREGFSPTTNVAYWVISRVFHLFPSAENLISLFVHTRNVPFTTETFETQSENLINYKFNIFKSSLARKWYFVC
mgnify:CR=1 FL=1